MTAGPTGNPVKTCSAGWANRLADHGVLGAKLTAERKNRFRVIRQTRTQQPVRYNL